LEFVAMIQNIRFPYNEYSMLAALHLLAATMIMGVAILAIHVVSYFLGAPVGLFDNPALAIALRPIMAVMTLPALGCLGAFIFNFAAFDDHDDARLLIGNAVGQIACVAVIPMAISASMANLAAM
jgi:hypothetical protein